MPQTKAARLRANRDTPSCTQGGRARTAAALAKAVSKARPGWVVWAGMFVPRVSK